MNSQQGQYFEFNEKERDLFLSSLTYKESVRLTEELIRFYDNPVFNSWHEEDHPLCLAEGLKRQPPQ